MTSGGGAYGGGNKMARLGRMMIVAFVYIGTVVGAGFASGQEIWYFFSRYQEQGAWGLLGSAVIFVLLGVKAMEWGRRTRAQSYQDFFREIIGPRSALVGDLMMTVFLFFLIGIMLAGSGAVTATFGRGWALGTGMAVLGGVLALLRPLTGLKGINTLVVPLLCLTGLLLNLGEAGGAAPLAAAGPVAGSWFWAAIQYSAYNLILALPVLVTLYRLEPDPGVLKGGGILGGIALGLLAFLFHLVLKDYDFSTVDLPVLALTRNWRWGWPFFYSFVLWGELFTSLVANAYGLVARFRLEQGRTYPLKLALLFGGAALVSRLGFARLLKKVYPLYGYFALTILLPLAFRPLPAPKEGADNPRKTGFFDRPAVDIKKRGTLL